MKIKALDVVSNRICPSLFNVLRYSAPTSNQLLNKDLACLFYTVFNLQVEYVVLPKSVYCALCM
jgi:hypothetical protein